LEIDDATRAAAVKEDWRGAGPSPREEALCAFAEKLTREPGRMREEDLAPLRSAGLGDAGILDLCQVVSYFNYINRIADGLGVDPEPFMTPPR
jgi:uncharacterized peroxidase-related enzyme